MAEKYEDDCTDTLDQVLAKLGVTRDGLSNSDVAERQAKYGKNELPKEEPDSFWEKFVEQFDDPLVKILLGAAAISGMMALQEAYMGELSATAVAEPIVILVILIANAYVGAAQEMQAESAIEALQEYSAAQAKVYRKEGGLQDVDAIELVPGDIVRVAVGDNVPADIRVVQIESTQLKLDQAIVTGEAVTVGKVEEAMGASKLKVVLQDKKNTLFMGTNVAAGKALGVVVGTGTQTEIGKIQNELNDTANKKEQLEWLKECKAAKGDAVQQKATLTKLEQSDVKFAFLAKKLGSKEFDGSLDGWIEQTEESLDDKTPLGKKIAEFGEWLCDAITYICILVWVIEIYNLPDKNIFAEDGSLQIKGYMEGFKLAVSLAVAAIPEGLPAVITTCLALGTQRMAKKNALVRKLPSVETLGCTSVICSDKTGTLTTNMMSVTDFFVVNSKADGLVTHKVEGHTFDPIGAVTQDGAEDVAVQVKKLCQIATIANDCTLIYDDKEQKYAKSGEPTEAALLVLAEKLDVNDTPKPAEKTNDFANASRSSLVGEGGETQKGFTLEFDRDRKRMSAAGQNADGAFLFVKGAPEMVLEKCSHVEVGGKRTKMTKKIEGIIKDQIRTYSTGSSTLRCIGHAYVKLPNYAKAEAMSHEDGGADKLESDLTFVGVAGMIDPARPEVAPCIVECKKAGIRVIMITGDNIETAVAIATKIGIVDAEEQATAIGQCAFLGAEFAAMGEEEQKTAVRHAKVFARVEPKHKSAIVELLQADGHIAAMTGDGVNDAPALKKANIGIAMGSGTAVAKSASAMVLADDNFATIVHAVEEGRAIYNNTKQFIRYLISSNIGEVVSIFLNTALGCPQGLVSVQLLWVNLVTDGLPATALGFNPSDLDIMEKKPRKADDSLINGWLFFRYMAIGLWIGFATVAGAAWWFVLSAEGPQIPFDVLRNYKECNAESSANFVGNNALFYNPAEGQSWPHKSYVGESPCEVFKDWTPMTMALTVLVMIELLNALNSVSEDQSMLAMAPWQNMYLIGADLLSLSLHFVILYIPFFAKIFQLEPLDMLEWEWVMYLSVPVILIDEVLKLLSRVFPSDDKVDLTKKDK